MKRTLQITALALALGGVGSWLALVANRGWTRTTVPVRTVDGVAGIEGIEYRRQFVPGLELLGGVLLGAGILAGTSLVWGRAQPERPSRPVSPGGTNA